MKTRQLINFAIFIVRVIHKAHKHCVEKNNFVILMFVVNVVVLGVLNG
jgi:hypothetical protein